MKTRNARQFRKAISFYFTTIKHGDCQRTQIISGLRLALSSSGTTMIFKLKGESVKSLTDFAH